MAAAGRVPNVSAGMDVPLHEALLAAFKVCKEKEQEADDARKVLEVLIGQAAAQLAEDDCVRERFARLELREAEIEVERSALARERAEFEQERSELQLHLVVEAASSVTACAPAVSSGGEQREASCPLKTLPLHGAPMKSQEWSAAASMMENLGTASADGSREAEQTRGRAAHEGAVAEVASDAEGATSPEGSESSRVGNGGAASSLSAFPSVTVSPPGLAAASSSSTRAGGDAAATRAPPVGGRVAEHEREDDVRWAYDSAAEAAATASRALQEAVGYAGGSEAEEHLFLAQRALEAQPRTAEQAAWACDAVRAARGCCPPEADAAVKAATKAIRDVVVLRCCTMAGHSNRAAVLVALAEAFGRQLDCELESQLLLAYGRVTRHVADAFTSNNQLRGARRLRKKPPRAQLAAQQAAQAVAGSMQPSHRAGSPLALRVPRGPPVVLGRVPWTLPQPALLPPGLRTGRAPGRCASVDLVPHVVSPCSGLPYFGARPAADMGEPREGPFLFGTSNRATWRPLRDGMNALEPQWVSLSSPPSSYARSHSACPRVGPWGGSTAVHDESFVYTPCAFEEAGGGVASVQAPESSLPAEARLPSDLFRDDDREYVVQGDGRCDFPGDFPWGTPGQAPAGFGLQVGASSSSTEVAHEYQLFQ